MSFILVFVIFVLFVVFVLGAIGGLVEYFRGNFKTPQEYFSLVLLILLSILFGFLLFTGQISIY